MITSLLQFLVVLVVLQLCNCDVLYSEANTLNFYITYDNISGIDLLKYVKYRPENEKFDKGIKCCHSINNQIKCTATDTQGKCFAPQFNNTGNYDLQMNFSYAQNICKMNGYRLCTMNEVISLCVANTCNLNDRGIWTTSKCNPWYWQRKSGSNSEQCSDGRERSGAVKCVNNTFDCITKVNGLLFDEIYGYKKEENASYLEAVAICNKYNRRLPNYNESLKDEMCHGIGLNKKWSWTTDTCSYTLVPSLSPTHAPSNDPTTNPTHDPTIVPSLYPSIEPSLQPTVYPSINPTNIPSSNPSQIPSVNPSHYPTSSPSLSPTHEPSILPSHNPSFNPTQKPSVYPTSHPTRNPSLIPSLFPSKSPLFDPTITPSINPTILPTQYPSISPSFTPSRNPTNVPSNDPSFEPTETPTYTPNDQPSVDPTYHPSIYSGSYPTKTSSIEPTTQSIFPSTFPSVHPSNIPSKYPTHSPTINSTITTTTETSEPSLSHIQSPNSNPTVSPIKLPSILPSITLSINPSESPTTETPSKYPSNVPSISSTMSPSTNRSLLATKNPTKYTINISTTKPTNYPSTNPILHHTLYPTYSPIAGDYILDFLIQLSSNVAISMQNNIHVSFITKAAKISIAKSISKTPTMQNNYDNQNWKKYFKIHVIPTQTNTRRLLQLEPIDLLLQTDKLDIMNTIKSKVSDENDISVISSNIEHILQSNFSDPTLQATLILIKPTSFPTMSPTLIPSITKSGKNRSKSVDIQFVGKEAIFAFVISIFILLVCCFFAVFCFLNYKEERKEERFRNNLRKEIMKAKKRQQNISIELSPNSGNVALQVNQITTPTAIIASDQEIEEDIFDKDVTDSQIVFPRESICTSLHLSTNTSQLNSSVNLQSDIVDKLYDEMKNDKKVFNYFGRNEGEFELDYSKAKIWTTEDVCQWLVNILKTDEYNQLFKDNCIDGNSLMYLTSNDLREMGIKKIGHKRVILTNIKILRIKTMKGYVD